MDIYIDDEEQLALQNATTNNQILQIQILKAPEQYLWIHRRFKTRPEGKASFY